VTTSSKHRRKSSGNACVWDNAECGNVRVWACVHVNKRGLVRPQAECESVRVEVRVQARRREGGGCVATSRLIVGAVELLRREEKVTELVATVEPSARCAHTHSPARSTNYGGRCGRRCDWRRGTGRTRTWLLLVLTVARGLLLSVRRPARGEVDCWLRL
jgi:hypothetical protein